MLERLAARHEIAYVLTQPDRQSGRGRRIAPPPAKKAAEALGIPVRQPERLGEEFDPEVDTLVVFLHWGTEQTICASTEQKSLAQDLLAAGADIIVGSHAHRVFGAGRAGNALVAYGLGNFIYWREDGESGRSGILVVTAPGRHIDAYTWVPARITQGIAIPETGSTAAADLAEWQRRRSCSGLAP